MTSALALLSGCERRAGPAPTPRAIEDAAVEAVLSRTLEHLVLTSDGDRVRGARRLVVRPELRGGSRGLPAVAQLSGAWPELPPAVLKLYPRIGAGRSEETLSADLVQELSRDERIVVSAADFGAVRAAAWPDEVGAVRLWPPVFERPGGPALVGYGLRRSTSRHSSFGLCLLEERDSRWSVVAAHVLRFP